MFPAVSGSIKSGASSPTFKVMVGAVGAACARVEMTENNNIVNINAIRFNSFISFESVSVTLQQSGRREKKAENPPLVSGSDYSNPAGRGIEIQFYRLELKMLRMYQKSSATLAKRVSEAATCCSVLKRWRTFDVS